MQVWNPQDPELILKDIIYTLDVRSNSCTHFRHIFTSFTQKKLPAAEHEVNKRSETEPDSKMLGQKTQTVSWIM